MTWSVYLAGEIHSDWRTELINEINSRNLPILFTGPVTNHANSDDCGVAILGEEEKNFWKDNKGAGVNAIRTRALIEQANIVVVRFGDKYRQWNAAFDAGYASALGKPLIIIQPEEYDHALKEVDRAALATARNQKQVAEILEYVLTGELNR